MKNIESFERDELQLFQKRLIAEGIEHDIAKIKLYFDRCIDDFVACLLNYLFNGKPYALPAFQFEDHLHYQALFQINKTYQFYNTSALKEMVQNIFYNFLNKNEILNKENEFAFKIIANVFFQSKVLWYNRIRVENNNAFSLERFYEDLAREMEDVFFKNINNEDLYSFESPILLFVNTKGMADMVAFIKKYKDPNKMVFY